MEYKRLTKISEITESPTLKDMCECCGESGCDEFCEIYQGDNCKGCPVQKAFERLAQYEDSGLSPENIKELTELYQAKIMKMERGARSSDAMTLTEVQDFIEKAEGNIKGKEGINLRGQESYVRGLKIMFNMMIDVRHE